MMDERRELNLYLWQTIKGGFYSYLVEHEGEEISHTEAVAVLQYAIDQMKNVPLKF